jgi:hypothetical protein
VREEGDHKVIVIYGTGLNGLEECRHAGKVVGVEFNYIPWAFVAEAAAKLDRFPLLKKISFYYNRIESLQVII